MKKKKSTKAKVRNLVRITIILFLGLILSSIFCKKEIATHDKILEKTVNDAFVFQSMLLAHNLEPNKPNSYIDIEALENENDSESFVSDAAIKTGKSQYYIRVNYGANCVTIYSKDDDGNYTVPYKAMICSSGKATPKSGTYKITYKYRWLRLFGDVYGQYSTRIVKSILFHSVPYFEQSADTLEYEEYDKLGTTASAGCIRLTVQDAKWIYDNITSGTYVEFYSDTTNPGPLGKPKAQKISDNEECRDWDPTDPDKNNPWNGGSGIPSVIYTKPKNNITTNTTVNTTNSDNNKNDNSDDKKDDDKKQNTTNKTSNKTTSENTSINNIKNTSNTHTNTTNPSKDTHKDNTSTDNTTNNITNNDKNTTTSDNTSTNTTNNTSSTKNDSNTTNSTTNANTQTNTSTTNTSTENTTKPETNTTKPIENETSDTTTSDNTNI